MDDLRSKITSAIIEFDDSYDNLFSKLNSICSPDETKQSKNLLIKHYQDWLMVNSIRERGIKTVIDCYFIAIDDKFIKLKYTQRFNRYECKGGYITDDNFYNNVKTNNSKFESTDKLPDWILSKNIMMKSARS